MQSSKNEKAPAKKMDLTKLIINDYFSEKFFKNGVKIEEKQTSKQQTPVPGK